MPMPFTPHRHWTASAAAALVLMACGGSSDSNAPAAPGTGSDTAPAPAASDTSTPTPTPTPAPSPGTASSALAQQCSPNNPYVADAEGPTTVADLTAEKRWLRSYFDEKYLWYKEIPSGIDANAPAFSEDTATGFTNSLRNYFDALVVTDRDRFSGQIPTRQWNALFQGGVETSTGASWAIISAQPPRQLRAELIYPNTPAAAAGLQRGDTLVSVNGYAIATDSSQPALDVFNAFIGGSDKEASYAVVVSRQGQVQPAVTLTSKAMALPPVTQTQVITQPNGDKIGYLVFNHHIAPSEAQLIQSVETFKAAGIQDLVLDLRYNSGGYLYIASQLAYMIAGPARTQGKVFEQSQFNDKRTQETADSATPFLDFSCKLGADGRCTEEKPLPSLNLPQVYVLTSPSTCSASEAVINGLEGIDVQVHRIGATTCGKPYGFSGQDNCGITNLAIEFSGVNAKGFGDYANGFTARCEVADDFDHALGDPAEAQLAGALTLRTTGQCPTTAPRSSALTARAPNTGPFALSPIKSAKILGGGPRPRH